MSPQKRAERDNAPEVEGNSVVKELAGADQDDFNIGTTLVRDLVVSFRADLDARLWRKVRLTVSGIFASSFYLTKMEKRATNLTQIPLQKLNLFAGLVPVGIISSSSLRSVLASFAAVLDEPGVTAARGDRAAMCIIETMCRAGRDLALAGASASSSSESEWGALDEGAVQDLDQLVSRVEKYCYEYRNIEKDLVRPFAPRRQKRQGIDGAGEENEETEEDLFSEEVSMLFPVNALLALTFRLLSVL